MLHWPKTPAQIKEYVDECVTSMNSNSPVWYEFSLIRRDTSEMIGTVSLIRDGEEAEIGCMIHPAHRRQGFMSEAVAESLRFAFDSLMQKAVWATCTVQNVASVRLMEKFGMSLVLSEPHKQFIKNGREIFLDRLMYRISRTEWESRREGENPQGL
ncbi:MAG: GNAT family N-acetyltransferase [Clostridiales bacterium]|nr:GNAT family N-acetyltransferase [Clostridiales bacterium]